MVEDCPVDPETGEILPVVTIVTDNGGPFRSFRFEAFIAAHIEYNQIRPHEAITWNRPQEVHLGLADPKLPTFHPTEILRTP